MRVRQIFVVVESDYHMSNLRAAYTTEAAALRDAARLGGISGSMSRHDYVVEPVTLYDDDEKPEAASGT